MLASMISMKSYTGWSCYSCYAIPWFFEEGEGEKFWKNFQFVIAIANFSIHYDMMTFVCFKPVHNFVQSYQGHPVQSSYTVIIFIREN